jgi:chromosome segregation ATPase
MTNNGPYTVKAAAEKLGLSEQRVRQLCQSGELDGAYKQEGKWLVPARSVRERYAIKPPKVKADEDGALEATHRVIKELTYQNGHLVRRSTLARTTEKSALQKLENVNRELDAYKRALQEGQESLEQCHTRERELIGRLAAAIATIAELEGRIEDWERRRPLGARTPRLVREADARHESRRQG